MVLPPLNCIGQFIPALDSLNYFLALSCLIYLHWAISVATHLAKILGIKIFQIKY